MSNVDAPDVNSGETNNPDLLVEQSGIPATTKKFTIETDTKILGDLDVTGTVTATSFIGDGSQLTGISGGTGGGLDSAAVTLLVDSDYVQARETPETPQDFAYSSLTGAPTALSSFTNDTSYITAADIPTTVDSDYVAARAPAASGGLDSAGVISLTGAEVQTSAGALDYTALDKLRVEGGAIGLSTIDADTTAESLSYSGGTWQLAGNPVGASSQRITHHLWSSSYANAALSAANDVYVGSRYAGTKFSYPSMKSYVPTAAQFGGGFEWDHAGTTVLDLSTDGAVFSSSVTATSFVGDGSGLTNLPSGGGLDSAAVNTLIDAEVQDPTTLILGASSNAGVRLGSGATTNGLSGGSVSIGTNANSYIQSVAIGSTSTASGTGSVAIGPNSGGTGNFITAVGRQATTSGSNSVALGYSADAGNFGIALGDATSGNQSIAIGALASATIDNALHINANYNSGVGPTANGGLVIETSGARLEYSADSDWVFSGPVTSSEFKFSDGTSMTTAPTGGSGGLDSAATIALIGMQNKPAGDNAIQITPDTSTLNGDNNNIIIGTQISDMAGIGPQAVAMGYDIGAQANGVSIGYQAGAGSQSTNSGGVFIGSRTNYFGNSNPADYAIAIGHEAGAVYPGVGSIALGKDAGKGSSGDYTVAIGYNANNTSSFNNTIMIKADGTSAYNSTAQYDIDIRTSAAGSLSYNTTNNWTFGAGVTMTDLTASGATVVFSNLPTTDPVNAGQLWNDAGTLKISAG